MNYYLVGAGSGSLSSALHVFKWFLTAASLKSTLRHILQTHLVG